MRTSLLLLSAIVLFGCNPQLKGICSTNADCPSETQCVSNICVSSASLDAGPGACAPACSSSTFCDDGTCVSASTPFVNIVSPGAGAAVNGAPLTVLIQAHAPEAISTIQVSLNSLHGSVATVAASTTGGDGYSATLTLASSTITDGDYQLVATMAYGGKTATSSPVSIIIDKTPPVIVFDPVTYPTRSAGSPAVGAFLRDEQIVIDVDISDALSGLSASAPPVLTANGLTAVTGQPTTGHTYQFTFSGRGPIFPTISGAVAIQITATDAAGNQAQASSSFQLTRLRWVWQKPRTSGIPTAPAIAGTILVVGGSESYLYGIRRATGVESWEQSTTYPPVGHISVGATDAYVVTSQGYVAAVDPSDAATGNRVAFDCPSGTPTLLEPTLRTMVTGGAIGTTPLSGSDSTPQETLFVYTEDGHLQLFRQNNFPGNAIQSPDCVIDGEVSSAQNAASVPALLPEGTSTVAFVGDTSGNLNKVAVTSPTTAAGLFSFSTSWSYSTGAAVNGPPALATPKGATGVLAGNANGVLQALDLNKNVLWTTGPLQDFTGLRASPVADGSSVYLLDQEGNADKVSLSAGTDSWSAPITIASRSTSANAAPVLAKDGSLFLAAGTKVAALDGAGNAEWTFDAQDTTQFAAGQAVDTVSPVLSCTGDLYVVATASSQGYVHDIITDSTGGPGTSGWPRAFHDSHNTSNYDTALAGTTCTE